MSVDKSKIVVIVGSNPLPNLLVVDNEKPQEVILLYSQQTSNVAKRLRKYYREAGIETKNVVIRDATDSNRCRAAVTDEMGMYRLDYTGGTKVMSSSIHAEWSRRGGTPDRASYVDDRSGLIRFDDGRSVPLKLTADLHSILRIHGLNPRGERFVEPQGPRPEDAAVLARKFLTERESILELARKIGEKPVNPADYGLKLSRDLIGDNLERPAFTEWSSFLRGKWLELWVGELIRQSGFVDKEKVHIGLEVQIRVSHFELDVVVLHQHRVYVISCTTLTDRNYQQSKMKLFEVMIRARQIGGSLARAALVAPLGKVTGGDGKVVDRLATLQQTAAEMWDSANPPRVFGIDHMKEWAGLKGSPNLDSLYKWLES
ncbi:MAG: hypothetical protein DRP09_15685 [Candidatus Thorarchaeota archaeon]|nr:MAG: hypothetical protein DRP09_15685 [Candidatus Thorarchaeota archaeon]